MAWRSAAGLRHSRGPVCVLTPSSNRTPQPQTEKIAVARDSDLVYLFSKNPLEQAGVSPWLEFVPKRSDEMEFTFMKRLVYLVSGLAGFGLNLAFAGDMPPRGNLLELHSCALYAGGCVVSSEATLEGRYMLRAWNFTSGTFNGTSLFTVAEDQGSQITEPLLKLKWADAGKRSVFLARFGEPVAAKSLYVTLADLCSSAHNPL